LVLLPVGFYSIEESGIKATTILLGSFETGFLGFYFFKSTISLSDICFFNPINGLDLADFVFETPNSLKFLTNSYSFPLTISFKYSNYGPSNPKLVPISIIF
jgi:hypothetical protein